MDSSTLGILAFLTVMAFVMWNFYAREQKQNNFLKNKIQTLEEAEKGNTSKRIEKLKAGLEFLENPTTVDNLISTSYFAMIISVIGAWAVGLTPMCIVFAVITFFIPEMYIFFKTSQRKKMFEKQFPQAIDQLLAVLQSGQTPQQGYKKLSEKMPYPTSYEFRKLYTDIKTGASLEKSLTSFYERNPNPDIRLFMIGMIIASEASPAVAINTLKSIGETIRIRESQKKSAKSTTMQGKASVIVLSCVPIAAFIGISIMMPTYMDPMTSTTMGKGLLTLAFVLDGIGFYIANKITDTSKIVKQ